MLTRISRLISPLLRDGQWAFLLMKGLMKRIAVIDSDIVAYRCAAANERRSVKATHIVTGQVSEHAHRTGFKEHIKGLFEPDEFTIEDLQHPEELRFALHAMNTTIDSLKESCDADSVELYISGKDNFRDSLPLPSRYKGKRTGLRPSQLQECRDHLVAKKKAVVINGREVDDMLAQRCYEGIKAKQVVIACTIDGDQNGVEGWAYNWTKQKEPKLIRGLGEISLIKDNKDFDGYGRKFFFAQWVLGDATDNFKPSEIAGKKFGVVAMHKLLADCKTDKECVEAVYKQYAAWYPGPTTYTDWTGTEQTKTCIEIMDMYAACAHMKRWEDDVFDTEKLLNVLGVKH